MLTFSIFVVGEKNGFSCAVFFVLFSFVFAIFHLLCGWNGLNGV